MATKSKWFRWINKLSDSEMENLAHADYPVKQLPEQLKTRIIENLYRPIPEPAPAQFITIKKSRLIFAFCACLVVLLSVVGVLVYQRYAGKSVICSVSAVTGDVRLTGVKGKPLAVDIGTALKAGYTVETAEQAELEIQAGTASIISLGSLGKMTFEELVRGQNKERVSLFIKQGNVGFELNALPRGSQWNITTETALIQVTGTEFRVKVENNNTFVSVARGEVNVRPRIALPALQPDASASQQLFHTIAEEEGGRGEAVYTGDSVQILYDTALKKEWELDLLYDTLANSPQTPGNAADWAGFKTQLTRQIQDIFAAAVRMENAAEPGIIPLEDNQQGAVPAATAGKIEVKATPSPESRQEPEVTLEPAKTPVPTGTPEATKSATPASRVLTDEARRVLEYISALSFDKAGKALVGQLGYGADVATRTMTNLVNPLYNATGKWPALVGCEYEILNAGDLAFGNLILSDYWNKGGLIIISWLPMNPWMNDEMDIINNPGDGKLPWNKTGVILADLIDPEKPVAKVWQRKLDRIATGLLDLKNKGVVVLWNPLLEMNHSTFWWGVTSHPADPVPAINLYRHMFRYFTETKGLTNLLWVYTVLDYKVNNLRGDIIHSADWCYPGDEYVDIIAAIVYKDNLDFDAYNDLLKMGKPLGLSIYNSEEKPKLKGDFDNRKYIERIRKDYPAIAFWCTQSDYSVAGGKSVLLSLVSNLYARELMNDPDVITRDDVAW